MLRTTLALAAIALSATAARAAPPADPAPVIAAERAFSAKAADVGVGPSFLAFMADQAIVFNPHPVSAKAFYGAQPPGKTPKEGGPLLAWWPNFAGASRSGDLGFTTGPASVNGKPPGLFYFTIWARQADGGWKWVYDGGVQADGAGAPGPDAQPAALPPGDPRPMAPALAWACNTRSAAMRSACRWRVSASGQPSSSDCTMLSDRAFRSPPFTRLASRRRASTRVEPMSISASTWPSSSPIGWSV